jgi:hypothetical protein
MTGETDCIGAIVIIPRITETRVQIYRPETGRRAINTLRGTGPRTTPTAIMTLGTSHTGPIIIVPQHITHTIIPINNSIL